MAIEMILLDDVAGLGKVGEKVRVSNGYARNYLLPRKKAELVTKSTERRAEAIKIKMQAEHAERVAVATALAEKLAAVTLTFHVEVGENDKMFGSVSAQMIADALKEQGFEIEKNIIALDDNIRALGEYDVNVKLHQEVTATVKVIVSKKED